ncbi:MAG TPA: hypothetical protein VF458_14800 [Ktedonobacteraceae bacterium]
MNSDTANIIHQEDVQPETSPAPAAQKSAGRLHVFLLLLLSGLALFVCTYISAWHDGPTGDEPHYLVISQTLWLYHSLDVTLDYSHNDYKVFYRGPLGPLQHTSLNKWGQLLPLHSIGVPVLWVIPFALAGKLGTLMFMSLISVLIVLACYSLLISLGIQRNYAFLTSLGLALASPVWVFSHRNFVEPVAALFCIYIVQVIFKKRLRAWDLIGASLALGILPWVHIRFAQLEIVLACFLVLRVFQDYRLRRLSPYLAAILPVAAMFLAFEAYNYFVWGSLNPAVNQANSGEVPFDVAPWRGLYGLFFDQEYGLLTNFPIFLFLLGGLVLSFKKRFLRFNLLVLFLAVPYIITIAAFHNWDGAISPPARFLMVLVPVFSFYLALALQSARSWIINVIFIIFMGVSMLYEGVSMTLDGGWINWQRGFSPPLLLISQALHIPLVMGVPTVMQPIKVNENHYSQVFPVTLWLVLLLGLALTVILLNRRQAVLAENTRNAA